MGRQRFGPDISHIQTYFITPTPSRSVSGDETSGSANSALVALGLCHVSGGYYPATQCGGPGSVQC